MKRILTLIAFCCFIFSGCENNTDVIQKSTLTKIADIYGANELYYGSGYNVFIKSDGNYQMLSPYLASYPEVSSDGKSFAYIGPVEASDIRGLYVYNLKKDNKILIHNDNSNIKITPKVVKWLDNQFLLIIADNGLINVDSKLYLLDTIQESLYVLKTSYKSEEFKNIQVENQMITIEIGDRDNDAKDKYKNIKYSYKELLSQAKVNNYQKIGELVGNVDVYYGGRKDIFIESAEKIQALNKYVSLPSISPDKSRIAYIDGEQDSQRKLYIFNAENEKVEIILETDRNGLNTPKDVEWFDNNNLLVIVGYGYGTVLLGGGLYIYDIDNKQLNLLLQPEKGSEFRSLDINEELIILEAVRWVDDNYSEYLSEEITLSNEKIINYIEIE